MIEGMPGAIRFVSDILAGKPGPLGCKQVEQSDYTMRAARQGLTFTGILGIGMAYMGLPVGPSFLTSWITKFPD
jgi:hypothetical protein